ncbi:MAG: hypothetical protein ACOCRK_08370 [bacterium]
MDIQLGKKTFIRNAGKDEYWLQDIIYDKPSILGLGDLQPVHKEKRQSTGGRLDILLKDPEDNTMYEVEVMLGETDPSHIIRSIEYWDNEKRKYPQRQHFSILIAESFDRRYFNVIQILSLNIPIIAIQADLLKVNNEYVLNFTKILDVYVEPEDNEEETIVNESTWTEKSKWTLELAKEFYNLVDIGNKKINYTQSYISIVLNGKNSFLFNKRTQPNSVLWFNIKDDEKVEAIKTVLDEANVVYNYNKNKDFLMTIDLNIFKDRKEMFKEIVKIRYKEFSIED